jgi:hypothetical protein
VVVVVDGVGVTAGLVVVVDGVDVGVNLAAVGGCARAVAAGTVGATGGGAACETEGGGGWGFSCPLGPRGTWPFWGSMSVHSSTVHAFTSKPILAITSINLCVIKWCIPIIGNSPNESSCCCVAVDH